MNVRSSIENILREASEASKQPMAVSGVRAQIENDIEGNEVVTKMDVELVPATCVHGE